MDDHNWPAEPMYSRRRLLALGISAAVLAACRSDGSTSETTTPTAAAPTIIPEAVPIDTVATPSETVAVGTAAPVAGIGNGVRFGGGGRDGTVKIGFTVPLTGALAAFGEANPFIIDVATKLAAEGIMLGDKSYTVQIVEKDVASNADTAASCAGELINDDAVDLILAIATPEMINPVADQCEANGVPCLSTLAPWQRYFVGRGGDPAVGFDWTYHFFWGADQLVAVFADMWASIDTDKTVGLLCPDDPEGNALADATTGLPATASAAAYQLVDPGRFQTSTEDFSAAIGQMKAGAVEIVAGVASEPDFNAFWTQAKQQDFNPKLVTMAEAVSSSSAVEALGDLGDGLAGEVWWTPSHPFTSSLTGKTSQQLADDYESATGKQWTQFVGFVYALFEVCFDVLSRAGSTDKQAIAAAAATTNLDSIVGPIAYGQNGLPRNISPTPLVGGQWKRTNGGKFPFELLIVNNKQWPQIPTTGDLAPLV